MISLTNSFINFRQFLILCWHILHVKKITVFEAYFVLIKTCKGVHLIRGNLLFLVVDAPPSLRLGFVVFADLSAQGVNRIAVNTSPKIMFFITTRFKFASLHAALFTLGPRPWPFSRRQDRTFAPKSGPCLRRSGRFRPWHPRKLRLPVGLSEWPIYRCWSKKRLSRYALCFRF